MKRGNAMAGNNQFSRFIIFLILISSCLIYGEQGFFSAITGTKQNLHSAVFSNNRWFAVGDSGTILFSFDSGDHWTRCGNTGTTERINSITTWNGSQLVAVGEHGTVLSSSTGDSWTVHPLDSSADSVVSFRSITWTGTKLVAVGIGKKAQSDPTGSLDLGAVWISVNGSTWTKTYAWSTLNQVIWANSQIITGGSERVYPGDPIHGNQRNILCYSNNGQEWSSTEVSGVGYDLRAICWSGAKYVIAGWGEMGLRFLTSTTLGAWSLQEGGWLNSSYNIPYGCPVSIAWALQPTARFVAVADTEMYESLDGLSWVVCPTDNSNKLNFVTYSNQFGTTMAVGDNGTILVSMPDLAVDRRSPHQAIDNIDLTINRKNNILSLTGSQAFSGGPLAITMYSIDGKIQGRWLFVSVNDHLIVPIRSFSKGTYFFDLCSKGIHVVKKFAID